MLPSSWQGLFGDDSEDVDEQAKRPHYGQPIKSEVVARRGQITRDLYSAGEHGSTAGMSSSSTGSLAAATAGDTSHYLGRGPELNRVYRERVLVRVYDLGTTFVTRNVLNRVAKSYGAFHTGVEVYGREWSFGMTFDDNSTGVTWNPPGQNSDHAFRETLSMGYTTLSPGGVLKVIEQMKVEWMGNTYQLLTRNCHHFSDEFCRRLGVARLPTWVNTLAETGATTAEFLDSADSGYDGGEALFDFFRSVGNGFSSMFTGEDDKVTLYDGAERRRYMAQEAGPYSAGHILPPVSPELRAGQF